MIEVNRGRAVDLEQGRRVVARLGPDTDGIGHHGWGDVEVPLTADNLGDRLALVDEVSSAPDARAADITGLAQEPGDAHDPDIKRSIEQAWDDLAWRPDGLGATLTIGDFSGRREISFVGDDGLGGISSPPLL